MVKEDEIRDEVVISVAYKMLVAAKTAPKGHGRNNTVAAVLTGNEIKEISDYLIKMHGEGRTPDFFARDAKNLLSASALFLIGTRIKSMGLNPCGNCGFKDCTEKDLHPENPCAFNTGDLGIALGSAVSIATDNRIDNRIMYTVGIAAREMGILGEDVKVIYGIPMASADKNPFFDRK